MGTQSTKTMRRRGRPPGKRPKVPHRTRPDHESWYPLHVTLRCDPRVPSLRYESLFAGMKRAFQRTRLPDFRIVEYSVQSNHVHMIVEATSKPALTRGMRSFTVRANRLVNAGWGRMRGRVWAERYHSRPLTSARQVRNALVYCLHNFKKHQRGKHTRAIDPRSSGAWFEGWTEPCARDPDDGDERPTPHARTMLLTRAWRHLGLIAPTEAPRLPG